MKRIFFSMVSLILLLTSCQKEADFQPEQQLTGDELFIKRAVSIDTTQPVGLDTGFVAVYEYDAQKRVIKLTETEYDLGVPYTWHYYFSYSGSDTLPYKYTSGTEYSNDSVASFLTYANGLVVKDSSVYFVGSTMNEKQINLSNSIGSGKYLYRSYTEFPLSSGTWHMLDSVIFTRTVSNGNILQGVDSNWSGTTFWNKESIQCTYDTKRSPFANLPIWYNGYYRKVVNGAVIESANNLLSITITYDPGGTTLPSTYSYDYDSEGYPVTGRCTNGDYNKFIFTWVEL